MAKNPGKLAESSESTTFAHSGMRIDLKAPRMSCIRAADIAEHLAKQPMFRGATCGFYTAAQHCTLVGHELAYAVGPLAAVYGLLHHAERAYSDDPQIGLVLRAVVHEAFGLGFPAPDAISTALTQVHLNIELTELRQLCTGCDPEVAALERRGASPLKRNILPFGWDRAHDRYIEALRTYARLTLDMALPVFSGLPGASL